MGEERRGRKRRTCCRLMHGSIREGVKISLLRQGGTRMRPPCSLHSSHRTYILLNSRYVVMVTDRHAYFPFASQQSEQVVLAINVHVSLASAVVHNGDRGINRDQVRPVAVTRRACDVITQGGPSLLSQRRGRGREGTTTTATTTATAGVVQEGEIAST